MPLRTINKIYADNTVNAMDLWAECISAAGWEIFDQNFDADNTYVFKSTGKNNDEMPCYIHMSNRDANEVNFWMYAEWDNVSHSGTIYAGSSNSRIQTDDDGQFYIWCSATEESFIAVNYFNSEHECIYVNVYTPFYEPFRGRLADSVTAGSSKTITLSAGDADDIVRFIGKETRIFNGEHRELTTITNVIPSANQIVVDSLTYAYEPKDVISNHPHRWFTWSSEYDSAWIFEQDTNGTGNNSGTVSMQEPVVMSYVDPSSNNNKYMLQPQIIADNSNQAIAGIGGNNGTFRKCNINTTSEHTISVGDIDSGTVDTATSASITDSSKSWTVNQHANKVLIITAGTNSGDFRKILSNTSDTLTIITSGAGNTYGYDGFTVNPDGTSTYTICEEGWLFLYMNKATAQAGALRMM